MAKRSQPSAAISVIVKGCEYVLADTICNEGSKHVSIMKLKPLLSIKVWENIKDLLLTVFACVHLNQHLASAFDEPIDRNVRGEVKL